MGEMTACMHVEENHQTERENLIDPLLSFHTLGRREVALFWLQGTEIMASLKEIVYSGTRVSHGINGSHETSVRLHFSLLSRAFLYLH